MYTYLLRYLLVHQIIRNCTNTLKIPKCVIRCDEIGALPASLWHLVDGSCTEGRYAQTPMTRNEDGGLPLKDSS